MLFILLYYIILCAYKIQEILNINALNRIKCQIGKNAKQ